MSDGTGLRDEFLIDPAVTFLNHGSYGACPGAVLERYHESQLELERQPVLFLARRLDGLLADARAALGAYVGADPGDLVVVPNATAGVNIAAWPLGLRADEVLSTDLEYGALDRARERGIRTVVARRARAGTSAARPAPRRSRLLRRQLSQVTVQFGEICATTRTARHELEQTGPMRPSQPPAVSRTVGAGQPG